MNARLKIILGIAVVVLCFLCGCGSNPSTGSGSSFSKTAMDAQDTLEAHAQAIKEGSEPRTGEIPSKYWAKRIKALDPIKVYAHRVNLVVVQRISDGVEEGKYIYVPISSYYSKSGDDGFEFSPDPKSGGSQTSGARILDFKRTINE